MEQKQKKVCFAASSGGHFEQLMMLKPLMQAWDAFLLTERTDYAVHLDIPTYYLRQINRKEKLRFFKMFRNVLTSIRVFLKEQPDAVICTGVLATIPMCLLAKLFGRKLIYIESFAMIESSTKTGRLLYRFADQFYVQWEPMLAVYPDAIYLGGIY